MASKIKDEKLGFVGEITKIRTQPITDLLEKNYIPIISTVASDRQGNTYNINGDTAAAYLAGALGAERLIMMTDIAGILRDKDDPSTLVKLVSGKDIEEVTLQMIEEMVDDDACVISVYYGQDVSEVTASELEAHIAKLYPDMDVEVHSGGQPIYYYLVSVE